MTSKIILISSISDLNIISQNILEDRNAKIFSFELEIHKKLESKNIVHEIADDLLNQEERLQLFDRMLEFRTWHSNISSNDLEFKGVNLLKVFDTHEFHSYLMPVLVNLILIKRIIEKEKPTKIISTSLFEKIVNSIIKKSSIETKFFENKIEKNLLWDKITIKYNIGKIPISLNLSKNQYLKIKKFVEATIGFFYDFWLKNNSKKKSIVLLEFNPENFSNLLKKLKNYDGNVILVNRRRSAIWNKKAIDIVRKSNCKVVNFENILNKTEKQKIPLLVKKYLNKNEKFWENSEFFDNLFQIENCSFWDVIKEDIKRNYTEKLPNFISLVWSVENLFKNNDIRCIVSLNDVGETEKAFLEFNQKKVPSILLEHGFIERVKETKQFDNLDYVHFKDKLAVWGKTRKEWLSNEFNIDPNRIIVTGSPRHDAYFNSRIKKKNEKMITLLLAPNPIGDTSGLSNTDLKLRVNEVITKIFSIVKKFDNVKIIVKLHLIQLKHNEEIRSFIKKLDKTIPVYLSTSVIDTINNADVVMILSPEIYGTSTMLLESMILGKPTMNVVFDKKILEFNHVKRNAVFTISEHYDLEKELKKILFDKDFQDELIENADEFLEEFFSNIGSASENFSNILKSY